MAMDDPPLPPPTAACWGPIEMFHFQQTKLPSARKKLSPMTLPMPMPMPTSMLLLMMMLLLTHLQCTMSKVSKVQRRHQLLATLLAISVSCFHNYARIENFFVPSMPSIAA